jgi:hypothetical protein
VVDEAATDPPRGFSPDVYIERVGPSTFARGLWAGELKRLYSRLSFVDPVVNGAFSEAVECLERFAGN